MKVVVQCGQFLKEGQWSQGGSKRSLEACYPWQDSDSDRNEGGRLQESVLRMSRRGTSKK